MLTDRYGLGLSTSSEAARAAYVEAMDLLLSGNVDPVAAFGRAIDFDDEFALAHVGRAWALQILGDGRGARAGITRAREAAVHLPEREAAHLAFFERVIGGEAGIALGLARDHLKRFPRDAMVLAPCASVFGLIGFSGQAGREREQIELLDGLADAYGDDWWFLSQHAFALAETGQLEAARVRIERGMALAPRNAHGAHIRAHIHYEDGEVGAAHAYLTDWVSNYPRQGILHCHLNWHLALCELATGNVDAAWERYEANIDPGTMWGPPLNTMTDAAAFLWRAELAGNPRDPARWAVVHEFSHRLFPRAGLAFADVHICLADAITGDGAGLEARLRQLDEMARDGRAPAAPVVTALATAFAAFQRADWDAVIDAIEPVAGEHERIGGSRAQRDLVEFTLLKAYANAGRFSDLQKYLGARRMSAKDLPVAGLPH